MVGLLRRSITTRVITFKQNISLYLQRTKLSWFLKLMLDRQVAEIPAPIKKNKPKLNVCGLKRDVGSICLWIVSLTLLDDAIRLDDADLATKSVPVIPWCCSSLQTKGRWWFLMQTRFHNDVH